jgi:hypothetical protein
LNGKSPDNRPQGGGGIPLKNRAKSWENMRDAAAGRVHIGKNLKRVPVTIIVGIICKDGIVWNDGDFLDGLTQAVQEVAEAIRNDLKLSMTKIVAATTLKWMAQAKMDLDEHERKIGKE